MTTTKKKQSGIYITRREEAPWYRNWAVRLIAIALALVLCGLLTTLLVGENPIQVYASMITGAFGTARKTWITLQETAMLLCVALALAPAFRMRFWNLGGEGQILAGGLVSALCMILLGGKMPNALLIILTAVASILAGAVWGVIPAVCKAKWNTNETLFTLMMNYVATQLVAFFVIIFESPRGSGKIGIINQKTQAGWLPQIGSNRYLLNILIVVLVAVLMHIYLNYSKHGYELTVVGESQSTARYVGIKVGKTIIRTMFLSGALCGLAGLLLVAGTNHTITTTIAGGRGFTAVLVAWLAKFSPAGMIPSSLLLVFMEQGAGEISTTFALNQSFGDILTGIILFFIIGSEFFITYRVHFRGGRKEKEND